MPGDDVMATRRVYATQFGGWWSFTTSQWQAFVSQAIHDDGNYQLPTSRLILHKPKTVKVEVWEEDERQYYSDDPSVMVVRPLDQPLEWWEEQSLKK